jgi:hypothetical protein
MLHEASSASSANIEAVGHSVMANSKSPDSGFGHMTRDHYAGFGMIMHLTSMIDGALDQIIVSMTRTATQPAFYPILTFLSNKDKRDYITAMAKVSRWPPYAIKGIADIMDRVKTAASLRNDIAHCVWKPGRRKGAIKPVSLSARGVLKALGSDHNEREWTADQLMAEAKRIHELGTELAQFMKNYGLVPTFPETPSPEPPVARHPQTGKPLRGR